MAESHQEPQKRPQPDESHVQSNLNKKINRKSAGAKHEFLRQFPDGKMKSPLAEMDYHCRIALMVLKDGYKLSNIMQPTGTIKLTSYRNPLLEPAPEREDDLFSFFRRRKTDEEKLPVNIRDHEPRMALDGGPNGLMVLEAIVQDAAIALKSGGFLFLETGETQADAVKTLLAETGFQEVRVCKDLTGRDRVVCGTLTI